MAEVTQATNRIDLFCLAHLGANDDSTRRRFIRWNMHYFSRFPTFWLREGEDLNIAPPPIPTHSRLQVTGEGELLIDSNSRLIV